MHVHVHVYGLHDEGQGGSASERNDNLVHTEMHRMLGRGGSVRAPGPRQMVLRVGRHTVPPLGACDDRGCVCGRRGEVWWTRTWHVPCACMSPVRSSRLGTVKIALCKISVHAGVAFTPRVLWDCGQSSVTDTDRERGAPSGKNLVAINIGLVPHDYRARVLCCS